MKLTGEKYKKFIEQLKLGRDIICGSDFSEVLKFYQENNEYLYLNEDYDTNVEATEENLRYAACQIIDKVISNLHEGKNLSCKFYGNNSFEVTIKCSVKEKFINLIWREWLFDEPLFDQTFEIII